MRRLLAHCYYSAERSRSLVWLVFAEEKPAERAHDVSPPKRFTLAGVSPLLHVIRAAHRS